MFQQSYLFGLIQAIFCWIVISSCASEQFEGLSDNISSCDDTSEAGSALGQRILDFSLPTCDDELFEIRNQCGVAATNLILFTGWCRNCRDTINNQTPARIEAYANAGYEPILIITEDNSGAPPDAAFCRSIQQSFGVNYTVLYDADGLFRNNYGTGAGNDTHFLLDADLEIQFRDQYLSDAELNKAIEALINS